MESQQLSRAKLAILLFGVFVISFGVLAFEIGLTRVFSIMLDYHYTFLVVSLALFGLGLGGVLAHYFSSKTSIKDNFGRLAILSVIFSLLMTLLTLLTVASPNMGIGLQISIMFLPFLTAGTSLAMAYKIFVSQGSLLHFADLVGAALGSLAVVFFINWAGAPLAIVYVSILALAASTLFSLVSRKKMILTISVLSLLGLAIFSQLSAGVLNIQPATDQGKEISYFLNNTNIGGTVEQSKWTSFGQVDLVSSRVLPHEKVIFVDGGAGTKLYHFNGNLTDSSNSIVPSLVNSTMFFPYNFANKDRSLVIGPGGGVDVLTALLAGVKHIDAVDVNPGVVDIVKEQAAYDGGIYTEYSNVHVTVDDGRSYIKRSAQKYDVIMLDIPVTKTAQGSMGYSLAENYLFTTDSITDYLNHLNSNGVLAIVAHEQAEIYRLTSIAYQVLNAQGLSPTEMMQRIAVVGKLDDMGMGASMDSLPVFILSNTPLHKTQATNISIEATKKGFQNIYTPLTIYNSNRYDPSINPYVTQNDNAELSTDTHLPHIATGQMTVKDLLSLASVDLSAPTDDKPFFYNFNLGIPETVALLITGAIILCISVSVLYVIARNRNHLTLIGGNKTKIIRSKFSAYKWYIFGSLGFGFMLIEVALIQKFILFLGEPTTAIAISLFSLLIAGGLGSLFSKRWVNGKQYNAFKVSLIIAAVTAVYIILLPYTFNATLSYSATLRYAISFTFIAPLGFLMGIPFPMALSYMREETENDAAWMWCINGAFSVLGSVSALALAMTYGFNAVLIIGAATYAVLFVIGRRHEKRKLADKVSLSIPRMPTIKRTWQKGKPVIRRRL